MQRWQPAHIQAQEPDLSLADKRQVVASIGALCLQPALYFASEVGVLPTDSAIGNRTSQNIHRRCTQAFGCRLVHPGDIAVAVQRSEEHTSELQPRGLISY